MQNVGYRNDPIIRNEAHCLKGRMASERMMIIEIKPSVIENAVAMSPKMFIRSIPDIDRL
jgi:hypothetical protein